VSSRAGTTCTRPDADDGCHFDDLRRCTGDDLGFAVAIEPVGGLHHGVVHWHCELGATPLGSSGDRTPSSGNQRFRDPARKTPSRPLRTSGLVRRCVDVVHCG